MSSSRSFSVGFMPIALMAQPSSLVLMFPPPSTSNSLNACNQGFIININQNTSTSILFSIVSCKRFCQQYLSLADPNTHNCHSWTFQTVFTLPPTWTWHCQFLFDWNYNTPLGAKLATAEEKIIPNYPRKITFFQIHFNFVSKNFMK